MAKSRVMRGMGRWRPEGKEMGCSCSPGMLLLWPCRLRRERVRGLSPSGLWGRWDHPSIPGAGSPTGVVSAEELCPRDRSSSRWAASTAWGGSEGKGHDVRVGGHRFEVSPSVISPLEWGAHLQPVELQRQLLDGAEDEVDITEGAGWVWGTLSSTGPGGFLRWVGLGGSWRQHRLRRPGGHADIEVVTCEGGEEQC